jgi:nucleotide-binding universal stress UspA family protein
LRIFLGVDRGENWKRAWSWVEWLRAKGPCELVLAYVYYPHDERKHYGLRPTHALAERDPEVEALLVRDMESAFGDRARTNVSFLPVFGIGRLGDHLVEAADAAGADVLVLGTHHRSGLARYASLSTIAIHEARASVAVVAPGPASVERTPRTSASAGGGSWWTSLP